MSENRETDYKPSSEWRDETSERSEAVAEFLKVYADERMSGAGGRKRYDGFNELHFSGSNMEVMKKIQNGSAIVDRVNILYEQGKPTQVHVVFNGEGFGHNIDAYLTNRALDDFLGSEASK